MFHWGTTRRNIEGVSFGLRSLFSPPLSIVDVEEKTATLSFSLLDHLSKDQLSVRPTPHSFSLPNWPAFVVGFCVSTNRVRLHRKAKGGRQSM
jgi:hypothetical protein